MSGPAILHSPNPTSVHGRGGPIPRMLSSSQSLSPNSTNSQLPHSSVSLPSLIPSFLSRLNTFHYTVDQNKAIVDPLLVLFLLRSISPVHLARHGWSYRPSSSSSSSSIFSAPDAEIHSGKDAVGQGDLSTDDDSCLICSQCHSCIPMAPLAEVCHLVRSGCADVPLSFSQKVMIQNAIERMKGPGHQASCVFREWSVPVDVALQAACAVPPSSSSASSSSSSSPFTSTAMAASNGPVHHAGLGLLREGMLEAYLSRVQSFPLLLLLQVDEAEKSILAGDELSKLVSSTRNLLSIVPPSPASSSSPFSISSTMPNSGLGLQFSSLTAAQPSTRVSGFGTVGAFGPSATSNSAFGFFSSTLKSLQYLSGNELSASNVNRTTDFASVCLLSLFGWAYGNPDMSSSVSRQSVRSTHKGALKRPSAMVASPFQVSSSNNNISLNPSSSRKRALEMTDTTEDDHDMVDAAPFNSPPNSVQTQNPFSSLARTPASSSCQDDDHRCVFCSVCGCRKYAGAFGSIGVRDHRAFCPWIRLESVEGPMWRRLLNLVFLLSTAPGSGRKRVEMSVLHGNDTEESSADERDEDGDACMSTGGQGKRRRIL
eukprot:ANDGO_03216.mRNA.1 hypothetical protein